jgi:hypothetical protein
MYEIMFDEAKADPALEQDSISDSEYYKEGD